MVPVVLFIVVGVCAALSKGNISPRVQFVDNGPFTFRFCDTNRESCQCASSPIPALTLSDINTANHFPDLEVTMTEDELDRYRALQMEYLIEFSKKPMIFEEAIPMPFCDIETTETPNPSKRSFASDLLGTPPKRPVFKPRCIPTTIDVKITFHVVTGNSTTNQLVSDEVISKQLALLTDAFLPLNIRFTNLPTTRHNAASGDQYRHFTHQKLSKTRTAEENSAQSKVMTELRVGKDHDVHIFIIEQIDDFECSTESRRSRTDGYCRFPASPRDTINDGCFIDIDSLPGVSFRGTGQGKGTTLVHEIGHWFGLPHVFKSDSDRNLKASCQKPETEVADTPVYPGPGQFEIFQHPCCKDTKTGNYAFCSGNRTDHVTNWMSYSSDKGVVDQVLDAYPWTRGQKAKAFTDFWHRRKGFTGVVCGNGEPMYSDGIGGIKKRDSQGVVSGLARDILVQPPALLESLKTICAKPINERPNLEIDPVTGKLYDPSTKGPLGWWYRMGKWRWLVLAIICTAALSGAFFLVCCFRRRRRTRRRVYTHVEGKERDENDSTRMEPLLSPGA